MGTRHPGAVVTDELVWGEGKRRVRTKDLDDLVPGLGSHLRHGTGVPDGTIWIPSTPARRGAWPRAAAGFVYLAMWLVIGLRDAASPFAWAAAGVVVIGAAGWCGYLELRGRTRLGLYLAPAGLVITRESRTGHVTWVPRTHVTGFDTGDDWVPRATLTLSALTPREKVSTDAYGSFDRTADELRAELERWRNPVGTDADR